MSILNRDDLRRIVAPSLAQGLGFILVAMVVLIAVNANRLLGSLAGYIPADALQAALQSWLHAIGRLAYANLVVLVLFWSAIGITAYAVSWAIFNSLIHTYNTAVIDTQFVNRGSWLERLSPVLLQLFFGVATIGLLLASGWLIPVLSQNFAASFTNWAPINLLGEAGQVILLALDLYACWALARLTFYVE